MNRKPSPEMRERALRMLAEARPDYLNMMRAVGHVTGLLRISPETLRLWQRRYEVDAGTRPGVTTDAAARINQLEKEVAELRKAERDPQGRECVVREGARPALTETIRFINEYRDRSGSSSSAASSDRQWRASSPAAATAPSSIVPPRLGS